ncbi:hypothetical protein Ctob_014889 [Chrysochromulina tobinii]|uniref:Selenoprotein t n=1 Tax=Chrysochromulina tobinii TaxID=1460289 RepID=A0A0M0KAA9_9EUKA|nr:hypothetical protein Ctob_014889 [Chrysochromulina tobinii]|eukprot:KOO35734.1 hypothetical protein Ctob_014889 [Chrysochromulina sp. CCMP291]
MAVGQPINRDRVAAKRPQSSASGNGLTSSQKTGLVLVAALCGPALLKKWYEKPASEKVDLSGFNIVTAYDTPAIERMDSTLGVAALYFFGDQAFGMMRRPSPPWLGQMHENKFVVAGGVYGLDVFAQTMKAINGFEITYNGQVLHSKLASGKFPESDELVTKLRRIISQENPANHD